MSANSTPADPPPAADPPPSIAQLGEYLERLAPLRMAESWDNVGLLIGDSRDAVRRVMTCLTLTPTSVDEAVRRQADLVVTHHPLPFRPLKRITDATTPGRLLLRLIRGGVAVYSPHTAFDSASEGINEALASGLGLEQVRPLCAFDPPLDPPAGPGSGRWGVLQPSLAWPQIVERVKQFLGLDQLRVVAPPESGLIDRLGVACGAGGEFLDAAARAGCQVLVTGEASFHTCLEAEALGVSLLLTGHFASERFALEWLATRLAGAFPRLEVWASDDERDPIQIA